jgi:hypothetical protein
LRSILGQSIFDRGSRCTLSCSRLTCANRLKLRGRSNVQRLKAQ